MPDRLSVSIVVPTLRVRFDVSRIAELAKSPEVIEIIVVSQHPEARASEGMEYIYGTAVHRLVLPTRGTSLARNTGLRSAVGNVVVFIDDDVQPHPQYASLIERTLGSGLCDVLITRCCYGRSWPTTNPQLYWPAVKFRDALASGSAIAINRSAFREADIWFREHLGGGQSVIAGEDSVFSLDAWRRGLRVWKSTFQSVLHPPEGSTGWRTDNVYLSSLAYVLRRHYGRYGWYVTVRTAARLALKNRKPIASLRLIWWFLAGRGAGSTSF